MPEPGDALKKLGFLTIGLFDGHNPGPGHEVTLDMGVASDAVERGVWRPQEARFDALVARFGYRLSPAAERARDKD